MVGTADPKSWAHGAKALENIILATDSYKVRRPEQGVLIPVHNFFFPLQ